jgi:hypothetical protein
MPTFNCVICKESSKGHGNNAQPLANGKCCDDCDKTVLCYRMMYAFQVFTCPKCRKGYTPKYKSLEEAKNNNGTQMEKEQHMSHMCSDECWYACSEEEIMEYKFLNPLNAHRPEQVIFM